MNEKKPPSGFSAMRRMAEGFLKDREKLFYLVSAAIDKARANRSSLKDAWKYLQALFRMIKAWASGEYRDISVKSVLLAVAAVVYFVNPFDAISDFIPGIGYVDDVTVVMYVLDLIKKEVEAFLEWEKGGKSSQGTPGLSGKP